MQNPKISIHLLETNLADLCIITPTLECIIHKITNHLHTSGFRITRTYSIKNNRNQIVHARLSEYGGKPLTQDRTINIIQTLQTVLKDKHGTIYT